MKDCKRCGCTEQERPLIEMPTYVQWRGLMIGTTTKARLLCLECVAEEAGAAQRWADGMGAVDV